MLNKYLTKSIRPLNRKSIPSLIIERITELIISKKLKPGDQLPTELELAQQLGVGRNSLREAIKILSYLGVVEIRRGIGTFIAESMSTSVMDPLIMALIIEQKTSKEIIELRLLIDTAAAEIVIQKASDEDVNRVEAVNNQLRKEASKNPVNSRKLKDLDIRFHETLLELTNNNLLTKIGKSIYTLFLASIEKTVEADPIRAVKNHQLVIDAIKKRDKLLLRKIMSESLSYWIDYIQS